MAALLTAAALGIGACRAGPVADQPRVLEGFEPVDIPAPPRLDPERVTRGAAVYGRSCASCHGPDLAGEEGWKTQNEDGTWKSPPHDSTGHTWHHPDPLLIEIVEAGGGFPTSRMPGFGSVLSEDDILDVLEFIKSRWGEAERTFQWQVTWQEEQRDRP